MRGHIRRRNDPGSWEYIIDVGMATAQRCSGCSKRFWMERKPKTACPKCNGQLLETEERRRKTQAGFTTRKECEAAMNKALTAVEERSYVVPSRITVREYLLKEWLPSIKGTVRPTTFASYTMHVEGHIVPALGSLQISRLSAQAINAFYTQDPGRWPHTRQRLPLPRYRASGACHAASGPQGRRALAAPGGQSGRCRRPTPGPGQATGVAGLERGAAGRLSVPCQGRSPLCPLAAAGDDRLPAGRGAGT